jgi:response regulator NasT
MQLQILLIADRQDPAAMLVQILQSAGHRVVATIRPDDYPYHCVHKTQPDAVVMSLSVIGAGTVLQMEQLSRECPLPVIIFADDCDTAMLRAAVKAGVTVCVTESLTVARVVSVLESAVAQFSEFQALRRERDLALARLSRRQRTERATGILMRWRGLPEKEAQQALQRIAKDRGIRLADAAENIITAEESLCQSLPRKQRDFVPPVHFAMASEVVE